MKQAAAHGAQEEFTSSPLYKFSPEAAFRRLSEKSPLHEVVTNYLPLEWDELVVLKIPAS